MRKRLMHGKKKLMYKTGEPAFQGPARYLCSSQISFPGSVKGYPAGELEGNSRVRGRRGHGSGTYKISCVRSTVSS